MRCATWNLHELGAGRHGADQFQRIVRVLRSCAPDVLAVQELHGSGATDLLDVLAAETGLTARLPDGTPALAGAGGDAHARYHVALLWRAERFVPQTMRTYGPELWHNLLVVDGDLDGRPLRAASYHAPPFGRGQRADEAERVVSALIRPYGTAPPGIVGADWNAISADRVLRPGWADDDDAEPDRWVFHAPDPYAQVPWSPPMVYQTRWETDERTGRPHRQIADRTPGEILVAGGLHDTAALYGGEPRPTCGHHADDPFPPRAIDTLRVTGDLRGAVDDHQVLDSEDARAASDHLPVIADLTLPPVD